MSIYKPTPKHDCWYVRVKDRHGQWKSIRGFEDKKTTLVLDQKLESLAQYVVAGSSIPDTFAQWLREKLDTHRLARLVELGFLPLEFATLRQAIDEHIEAYRAYLKSRGRTPKHANDTASYAKRLCEGAGFKTYADLSADRTVIYLAELKTQGASQAAINHYVRAIKAFCRWMCGAGKRAEHNPVHWLSCEDEQRDRRHIRRVPTPEEIGTLIESTRGGPSRAGMTGSERALLYTLAVATGFRAGEIRSLTKASFNLTSKPPVVTCNAGSTKNRKESTQPLSEDLAQELASYLTDKRPADRAFNLCSPSWLIHVLRADLKAAGLSDRDAEDRVWDFHAFRHTFITYLDRAGIDPRSIQELARHGSLKMTLHYCQQKSVEGKAIALKAIPSFSRTG